MSPEKNSYAKISICAMARMIDVDYYFEENLKKINEAGISK